MGLKIVNKSNNPLPSYSHEGDAGMDIRAFINNPITLLPGKRELIGTGIYIQVPRGFECQVRSKSGMALKHGIAVLNSPGTIDCGFTGEIGVILINHSSVPYTIESGDKIAQLVFAPYAEVKEFDLVEMLDDTERGEGGFGSTGVK